MVSEPPIPRRRAASPTTTVSSGAPESRVRSCCRRSRNSRRRSSQSAASGLPVKRSSSMTLRAYSRVCSRPGTNSASYQARAEAADSRPTYSAKLSDTTSAYELSQFFALDCLVSLARSINARTRSVSVTPYTLQASSTSSPRTGAPPFSTRETCDCTISSFRLASRNDRPAPSRKRFKCRPSRYHLPIFSSTTTWASAWV